MKKKDTKHAKPTGSKKEAPKPKDRPDEDENRPSYGGLPDRDLKKNLGCG